MEGRKQQVAERLKDVLILLLTLSALWLAAQTPLAAPLGGLFQEEGRQTVTAPGQEVSWGTGALPMAMVVNLPGGTNPSLTIPEGSESVRRGLQYDQASTRGPATRWNSSWQAAWS